VERLAARQLPDFCPSGQITIVDTLLTSSIHRDSSHRGYVLAYQSALMLAAHLPGATDTWTAGRSSGSTATARACASRPPIHPPARS